jgi:aminoglycoside N3'-acetyltransferase
MKLAAVLDSLDVPAGAPIYVHSSMDWMGRAGIAAGEALDALLERSAGASFSMPTYPFRGSYVDYLRSNPPPLDIARTPSRIGLLNELFRRLPGARRSLDADIPISSYGPGAEHICGSSPSGELPCGEDSAFCRVIGHGGFLLGLGVSANTNPLIHYVDYLFRDQCPLPLFTEEVFELTVIDGTGAVHRQRRRGVSDAVQKAIRPGRLYRVSERTPCYFRSVTVNDAHFFRVDLAPWFDDAVCHAKGRYRDGRLPCWLATDEEAP